jgi:hypothetical protein
MLDDLHGTPVRLDFQFVPAPGGGFMCLFQQEETHDCYLVIGGYAPSMEAPDRLSGIALLKAEGYVQSVFGYPNEEAYWKDPRGELGHGFFEIMESRWFDNIDDYNVGTYGSRWFEGMSPRPELHHYFVGGKDASCQILAQRIEVAVFTDKSFEAVVDDVRSRLHW